MWQKKSHPNKKAIKGDPRKLQMLVHESFIAYCKLNDGDFILKY